MNRNKTPLMHSRPRGGHPATTGGFTLIELLLVLTLTASLLGGVISLVSIARQSSLRATQNQFHRQEIRRFADDVRRDVRHAARSVVKDGELVLTAATLGRTITYRIDDESLVQRRVVESNDSAPSVDSYAFGKDARVDVRWLEEIRAVRWTITPTQRPKQPIEILASERSTRE
ncbi:prepilin-type N-terminal cleavage/methylation domain-containing protein [Stieleria sp. ICT_E10.1]|uniref:prepilin-type N-terminal cleavage/methylation domain-containing protein n=1 Tax=Stieleria sedimenti TaxID=2976331 RepID=UPI002180611D|nr:prepilin-type N-terminal cleavage/methylation domain-containing protein [Stieleria sedimenti]MCS7469859.1 prepilin-type N-terminal cleavage/methylation domain-containing protein [Stieleria sedimenti]